MQNLSGFHCCVDSYSASKLDFSLFSRDLGLGDQTAEILNKNFCSKKFSQWWFSESRVTRCNGKAMCFSAWVSLLHFYWETRQLFRQHFVVHNCASYSLLRCFWLKPQTTQKLTEHINCTCASFIKDPKMSTSLLFPPKISKQTNKRTSNKQTNKQINTPANKHPH